MCVCCGLRRTRIPPHSMVFISNSWEIRANTKLYKIKLQKQNRLRFQYFRSTIHHDVITKNLIETNNIYISFLLYSSDPEETKSLWIYFNIFFVNSIFYCDESSFLVFWHHFEISEVSAGLQEWRQHGHLAGVKATLAFYTYNILKKINSQQQILAGIMWAELRGVYFL